MSRREHLHRLAIVVAGLLAYANSFAGVFLFDDLFHIGPKLADVSPSSCLGSGRGVVQCSLALDYARGGMSPWPYHLTNLVIHLSAALVLYAVVRRALQLPRVELPPKAAADVAAMTALLWAVHPLQTESVTYVIQRAEALVSLCYLVAVYAALRRFSGGPAWSVLAVAASLVGVCTKPVMATAPLLILLLDRTFVAESFASALRRRPGLYLGLFVTLGWLVHVLDDGHAIVASPGGNAGLTTAGVTPADYLLSQGGVILHYLRLAVVPHPLCLDYRWPIAQGLGRWLPTVLVGGVVLGGVVALARRSALGFLVIAFFLLLAPSSSLMPLGDLAVEHRMYLALAVVLLGAALAARRLAPGRSIVVATLVVATALGLLTRARNTDYYSAQRMYARIVAVRPDNERAQFNLANHLTNRGRLDEAIEHYQRALAIRPDYLDASSHLARLYLQMGDRERARKVLNDAAARSPTSHAPYLGLAGIAAVEGDQAALRANLERAVTLAPGSLEAHAGLARILASAGEHDRAVVELEAALRIDPKDAALRAMLEQLRTR